MGCGTISESLCDRPPAPLGVGIVSINSINGNYTA
jgi:hypothetical protein